MSEPIPSITITTPRFGGVCCTCLGTENVLALNFNLTGVGVPNAGTSISLCVRCRTRTREALEDEALPRSGCRIALITVAVDRRIEQTITMDVPTGIGARSSWDFGRGTDSDPAYRVIIERFPNRRVANGIVLPSISVFSDRECSCGFRHQVDGFKPGQNVEIVAVDAGDPQCRLGMVGKIVSWSQYGGPIAYHVRIYVGDDPVWSIHPDARGPYLFAYFAPCELEAV